MASAPDRRRPDPGRVRCPPLFRLPDRRGTLSVVSIHRPILLSQLWRWRRSVIVDDLRTYRGIDIIAGALHLADYIERHCTTPTLGVMLPTSGLFPMAALGGWMLGKTVVPLNYLLKLPDLEYVLRDCGTDTVITAGPLLEHMGYRPRVPCLLELDRLSFRGAPTPRWPASAERDDLALILYTGGTTGRPKGVMLTHGNITANIWQILRWVRFRRSEVLLGVLPQFHAFGLTVLTLLPLTFGCKVVYSARFVPAKMIRLLREHRPTVLVAIPSMYGALLHVRDAGPEDFASLRYVVSGAEPLPEAVASAFYRRFKVRIAEGYGLTETAPVSNWCRPWEWRPRSVGLPLPDIDQRIVDPNTGVELGPGQDGEIVMRGPNVTPGYYRLPQETAAAFDARGFFHTGDIGHVDADGHLYITGRIKEMMIIGGENVFPREIEEVLERHPAVAASGVVGIRDPLRGESPAAFVELREGATAAERDLMVWCRQNLPPYKCPGVVRIVDRLPRSPVGKVLRRELRAMLPATETLSAR